MIISRYSKHIECPESSEEGSSVHAYNDECFWCKEKLKKLD